MIINPIANINITWRSKLLWISKSEIADELKEINNNDKHAIEILLIIFIEYKQYRII